MTSAASRNERITIQRVTITYNEFNEPIETWNDLATVWAKRQDASAGESYRAQEVGAQITMRFTVLRTSEIADMNPKDRIAYDGRTFNITAVREVKRNRWLEIDAVARAE
jgi:SPP1 family predicted phage head-tail adaptor